MKKGARYAKVLAAGAVSAARYAYNKYKSRRRPASNKKSRGGPKTSRSLRLRKRNGRSRTRTSTKRRSETSVNSAMFSSLYKSTGRRLRPSVRNHKLVRANQSSLVSGFTYVSPWGGTFGAISLINQQTGATATSATGTLRAPLHIYDITASINEVGTNISYPMVGWELNFTNQSDTATAAFAPLTTSLERYDSAVNNPASSNQYPGSMDLLDYVSTDLLFYCPTTSSTRVDITFVQFTREEVHPTATQGIYSTAFWQNMTKRYMYSPLSVLDADMNKTVRVLKRTTFYMDPKESSEPVNTITKRVKLFHRFNRKCVYNYNEQDRVNLATDDMTINIGQNSTQVVPRARIYMIIRAQAQWATAFNTAVHPSYDISYRQKHTGLAV